jgi:hypothetical protein
MDLPLMVNQIWLNALVRVEVDPINLALFRLARSRSSYRSQLVLV